MARLLTTLLFVLVIVELFSVSPPTRHPDRGRSTEFQRGAIHVHSRGQSATELLESAIDAGLDFVVVTDLKTTRLRKQGANLSSSNVDLFVELEAETPAGHAILFSSHTPSVKMSDDDLSKLAWRHFLSPTDKSGVFVTIAHPSSPSTPWNRLDRFPDGIEVVNLRSIAEHSARDATMHAMTSLVIAPFNPFLALSRDLTPYQKDFLAWDAINAVSQGHFAYAATGNPAQVKLMGGLSLAIPSSLTMLRIVRNIIFTPRDHGATYEARKASLYRALQKGQCAIAFEYLYPFDGSEFALRCEGHSYSSGDTVPHLPPQGCDFSVSLPVGLPYDAKLVLYRDGEVFQQLDHPNTLSRIPVDTVGIYRLEVWVRVKTVTGLLIDKYVPYIFYNPIYIR